MVDNNNWQDKTFREHLHEMEKRYPRQLATDLYLGERLAWRRLFARTKHIQGHPHNCGPCRRPTNWEKLWLEDFLGNIPPFRREENLFILPFLVEAKASLLKIKTFLAVL